MDASHPVPVEEWRPTGGWPGYEVSDLGRVRRAVRGPGARVGYVLKPYPTHNGYLRVKLRRAGKSRNGRVHVLVCEAFHGPRPPDMEVRHLDGTKTNNTVGNLCWGTKVENALDARAHGTISLGAQRWNAKLSEQDVLNIRARYAESQTGRGRVPAGFWDPYVAVFDVSRSTLHQAATRRGWKHI